MKTRAKSYTFPKKSLILTHKTTLFSKDDFHDRMLRNFKVSKSLMTENDRSLMT